MDGLHDGIGLAMAVNAEPSCWFMHPEAFTTLRKLREGDVTARLPAPA